MAQPVNIGGVLYEDLGNGQLKVVGYASAPSQGRVFTLPLSAKEQRNEARQNAADRRAEQQLRLSEQAAARAQADFDSKNTMVPPPGDTTKTGEDYLATIPPALAAQVKALSDGRRAFPTGAALRSPSVQELIAAATQYDPTLDAANAATRVATRKDFTSGKSAQNITAINTALGHLGTLSQAAEKLGNRSFRPWNGLANFLETQAGRPEVKNFSIARDAVANELMRVFRQTGASTTEVEEWKRTIDSSDSPEQLRGEISKAVELLNSRLESIGEQYSKGMGKSSDPLQLLNPHAQNVFNHLVPGGDGIVPPDDPKVPPSGPTGPTDGTGPQTGAASGSISSALFGGNTKNEYSERLSSTVDSMVNAGASKAMIDATLAKQGFPPIRAADYAAAKKWMKDNPGQRYFGAEINRQVPLTAMQSFAGSPTGSFLAHLTDQGTAGLVGAVAGEKGRGALNAMDALHPDASFMGDLAGGVAGAAGTEAAVAARAPAALARFAPRIADALYGGATGFNQAEDGQGLKGALLGGATGLGGGIIGSRVARGLGAAARGVTNPAVQRLRALGIPLTVGEALGGRAKQAQDALTSVPLVGDMIANRYGEGRRAFNQAAFNAAGEPINVPINQVGQAGVDALDTAKSQAYSNALDPVSLDTTTPSFQAEMTAANHAATSIPNVDQAGDIATSALSRYIDTPSLAAGGVLGGPDFQQAYRGLARTGRQSANRIYGHEIGQVTRQGQDALASALEDQNPGAFDAFLRANSANRHLSVLSDAVNAAKNQVTDDGDILFTPAQLGSAATNNAKTFTGKIGAAAGNRPFNELAADAQQVMSSKLPDSGTAKRIAALALASGAGAGSGYGLGGGEGAAEGGLGTILLLAAGGSRPAQQMLVKTLADRPEWAVKLGLGIGRHAGIGGAIGAGSLPLTVGN